MSDRIVITQAELAQIELEAIKSPTKDGKVAPRVIKALIRHVEAVYGIDLGIETEDMQNERIKRQGSKGLQRRGHRDILAGESSDDGIDDF